MSFDLTADRALELAKILDRYPNKMAACIPVLHLAQDQHGFIDEDVTAWVARTLDLTTAHVFGVASFYSLLHTEPTGRHQIWLCRTLSCALAGATPLLAHCERKLGIKCGQTTPDGHITLRTAECLASCGSGPMMQVDSTYYENLNEAKVDAILDRLAAKSDS